MNILIANWTWYPSGGDWTYVDNIATTYKEKGHHVIPFSMKDSRNFPSKWSEFFIENIDYKKVNKKSLTTAVQVIQKSIYSTEAIENLKRLLEKVKIDLAHINVIHHYITPAILKTLKDHGIPIIWTLHEYTPICPESTFISHGQICEQCKGGAFYHCVTNKCKKGSLPASMVAAAENYVHQYLNYYQYVDHFICPSLFLYEKFKSFRFFPEKLVHIYHGYQYNEVEAIQIADNAVHTERYIVFVGRLEKIKGAHTLLNAMLNNPDIRLKIIGTGTQERELHDFASSHQMTNVTFLGKLSKENTLEIINGSAFLICPSEWYEVLGFTVVEAMALGKPVIGSAIGAIPEMVINGETGILFAPGNAQELSSKIKSLFDDPETISCMGLKAKKHIHQLINTEKHFVELKKLIPSL